MDIGCSHHGEREKLGETWGNDREVVREGRNNSVITGSKVSVSGPWHPRNGGSWNWGRRREREGEREGEWR